jgi:hypothetical protein
MLDRDQAVDAQRRQHRHDITFVQTPMLPAPPPWTRPDPAIPRADQRRYTGISSFCKINGDAAASAA